MSRLTRWTGMALAVLALAGCAGNQEDEGLGSDLRVTVQNDGTIPVQVRIFLVSTSGGMEQNMGSLSTLGSETLTASVRNPSANYRLRASGGTSYSLTSPTFTFRDGDHVVWDMRRNIISHRGT